MAASWSATALPPPTGASGDGGSGAPSGRPAEAAAPEAGGTGPSRRDGRTAAELGQPAGERRVLLVVARCCLGRLQPPLQIPRGTSGASAVATPALRRPLERAFGAQFGLQLALRVHRQFSHLGLQRRHSGLAPLEPMARRHAALHLAGGVQIDGARLQFAGRLGHLGVHLACPSEQQIILGGQRVALGAQRAGGGGAQLQQLLPTDGVPQLGPHGAHLLRLGARHLEHALEPRLLALHLQLLALAAAAQLPLQRLQLLPVQLPLLAGELQLQLTAGPQGA